MSDALIEAPSRHRFEPQAQGVTARSTFELHESNVRSYCRDFPVVFSTAKGSCLQDVEGRSYIDFLSGAGALNYGHNNDAIRRPLLRYIEEGGVTHGLDLHTVAKAAFIESFQTHILQPRGLAYKMQLRNSNALMTYPPRCPLPPGKLVRELRRSSLIAEPCRHGRLLPAMEFTSLGRCQ